MNKATVSLGIDLAAAVTVGAAMYVAAAGPVSVALPGNDLSIRTPLRPLVAALLLIVTRAVLARRASDDSHGASPIATAARGASRALLGGLVVAAVIGWGTFLSTTCGGADSYGYVSAASRLLAGRLVENEPLAAILPFERAIDASIPLGYVASGRTPNASVPAYPLGLPALMAVLQASVGSLGPFVVAPLMGLVLIAATSVIARRWFDDAEAALLAGALVALNPLVFTYAIQPMSDVPAAAAAAIAIAALSISPARPIVAGIAAASAFLIRPALAPMAVAIAAIPAIDAGRRGWRDSIVCIVPVAIGGLLQALSQWHLYGDAFGSGYGGAGALFAIEHAGLNVRSYGYWALKALGPVWLGALAIGLVVSGRRPRTICAIVALSAGLPYLFYRPYDHWETLRFLLPIIVVGTIVAAYGLMTLARLIAGRSAGPLVAASVAVAVASVWMSWLSANHVFTMPASEARHRVAADLVRVVTRENAVIMALQHTGSVRYYAGRQTVNWDRIPPGAFEASAAALEAQGYDVYLMLDSLAERAMFEARHGAVVDRERWLPSGQRGNVQLFQAPPRR